MTRLVVFLLLLTHAAAGHAEEPPRLRLAIERGLALIERGSARYTENRACFSCHHQLALNVLVEARRQGFAVGGGALYVQREFTRESFRPKIDRIEEGQGIPGANTMAAYALFVLEAAEQEPDETTGALVTFLVKRQKPDGSWPALANRPPSEGSPFTNAALALRALAHYGREGEGKALRGDVQSAWDRGRAWLLQAEPGTTEDRAFHLRALATAGAGPDRIDAARSAILREQRDDGGWAQLPDLASDAYATGIVLTALHAAGVGADDPALRRGVGYLLDTQQPDGGWRVATRSKPVQVFFDNGDPGGKSQFISFAATNWALLALLQNRAAD